jgi:hypothetical protein
LAFYCVLRLFCLIEETPLKMMFVHNLAHTVYYTESQT